MTNLKDVCRILLGLFLVGLFVKGTIRDGQVWVEEITKGPFYKQLLFIFTELLFLFTLIGVLLQIKNRKETKKRNLYFITLSILLIPWIYFNARLVLRIFKT